MGRIREDVPQEKPIAIPKNSLETIRVSIREYNGHTFADLGICHGNGNACRSTHRGITFSPRAWSVLMCGVRQLDEKLRETGLVQQQGEAGEEAVA